MVTRLPALWGLLALTLFASATGHPRGHAPKEPGSPPEHLDLREELESILAATGNRQGLWGAMAISLDRGDTLLALNPHRVMVPASNMKVLTVSAALHHLGPDFTYSTFLLTRGALRDGVLEGDLVLYGTGDPTLSERFYPTETAPLDSLAKLVTGAGIRQIQGDLLVDGTFFQGQELHPDWDPRDLNDPFAAPVSAVSYNESVLTLRVEAGERVGSRPAIHTQPPVPGLPVVNTARTVSAGTRSRIWLLRESPWDPIGIEGEIPLWGRDVWRRLPVPDPLVFAGGQLQQNLESRGVTVRGRVRTVRDRARSPVEAASAPGGDPESPSVRVLGMRSSPPLLEILRVVNKESHNLFAETVGKTLGRVVLGDGSFQGGAEAVRRFLVEEAGVPAEEVRIRDGSGLSPGNGISPGALLQVLHYMAESPHWDELWSTLPEAGVRRELSRMYRSPAARNLRAKTGTMEGVSALSGMVKTRSGERILFSIMANELRSEYRAKRAEDELGARLASLSRPLPP